MNSNYRHSADTNFAEQKAYWQQKLADSKSVLTLPLNYPRLPASSQTQDNRERATIKLSPSLFKTVCQFYPRENTTLYITLLAAWKALLLRYTGQEDLIVSSIAGDSFSNREADKQTTLLNIIPLRTQINADLTGKQLLVRVDRTVKEAKKYRDYPVAKLSDELDIDNKSLLQVMFVPCNLSFELSPTPVSPKDLGAIFSQTGQCNLVLCFSPNQDTIEINCEYNRQLFTATTIQRLLGHWQNLLIGLITNPEQNLAYLPLLTEAEQQQILLEWNDTQRDYPQDKCIHQLFAEQATSTPDKLAVVFAEQSLTYQELNQQAEGLAHYLQSLGVTADTLIGIAVERSLDMVVGILGILKAGGAYVPLDPSYPQERLDYMLADSGVKILLTQSQLVEQFSEYKGKIISLDADWDKIALTGDRSIINSTNPENLAYVIYTSGSTGKPKGVLVNHGNLVHSTHARLNYYPESLNSYLLLSSFAFDSSVAGIFWTLSTGGTLILPSANFQQNPLEIVDLVAQYNISHLLCLPSLWKLLLEQDESGGLASLKVVIVAGEVCKSNLVELHERHLTDTNLYNEYGPTEATVWSTVHHCQPQTDSTRVPIGYPIDNVEIYILDSHLQPVPIGVVGEIYIGGAGITKGYLNRPQLTKEKFIPHPFLAVASHATSLLYKTGDLGRYLGDGKVEFIDRLDNQLKIRGFRLELGEIDTVLSQHPQVKQTVVVARETDSGDKQLVAYVVPQEEIDKEAQREQVAQWQEIDDAIYSQSTSVEDPTLNLIGWNNSYDGQPIPEEEMREWVEETSRRILSYHPDRVLELGCGTGMLLFRIAPYCSQYWGTDISQTALDYIAQQLQFTGLDRSKVQLSPRAADNFSGIEPGSINTVILNSVAQHFPSADYLFEVIKQASQTICDRGFIFVGDVRNLDLLEAFHAAVQLHQADDNLSLEQLRQRIQTRIRNEEDLVIDPEFFLSLPQHLPNISYVEIQLKRGRYQNELTKFRYDVVLYLNRENIVNEVDNYLYWQQDNLNFAAIRDLIEENQAGILRVNNIPNARLTKEFTLLALLDKSEIKTVKNLRLALDSIDNIGIEPEEWWNLANHLAGKLIITWSSVPCRATAGLADDRLPRSENKANYDLIFIPNNFKTNHNSPQANQNNYKFYREYTNNPLHSQIARQLEPKLRNYLASQLPDYMIPKTWIILEKMPLNSNGKIDRKALPKPEKTRPQLTTELRLAETETEQAIAEVWQDLLQLEIVGTEDNFFELGGNSLLLIQLNQQLKQVLKLDIPVVKLFQYPTIKSLNGYLQQDKSKDGSSFNYQQSQPQVADDEIAIIGMAGRFPGANDLETFWQNLAQGSESISWFDSESNRDNPNYVQAGGILEDIEYFDAHFFGYSPKEAQTLDPQQRIFLECAWSALEDAGYNPQAYPGTVGVYAGAGMNTYLINNVYPQLNAHNRSFLETMAEVQLTMGQEKDFLPTRVSYKLNLTGPSINVQTACSTSLVAVHQACSGILNGECELALAGGVAIRVPQPTGYIAQENGIFSPDGHCRAFDAHANGTVFGNGAGIVVLKRLSQAIADSDQIYAVIKGSAINNDGSQKVSYAAPNVEAQAAVISQALTKAGIDAGTVDYIETHGTGTSLGDPIEIAGLTQAFRETTDKKNSCAIGSVKTNIGHLANAAGIAGLIKTVLALKNKQIPPSLHFKTPNPNIDFDRLPFYVNTQLTPWERNGTPRRAGVSSFGMGGTNCHVVLEEYCRDERQFAQSKSRNYNILTLSAKTETALKQLSQRYLNYIQSHPEIDLADLCFTANTGRKHFDYRVAIIADSKTELKQQLTNFDQIEIDRVDSNQKTSKIAFLFTGQGSQYINMGRQLYQTQPTFKQAIDRCATILESYLDLSLLDILFVETRNFASLQESTINQTQYTQPAIFAIEYALAQLWLSWGIKPDLVSGHSVGEYVAATIAGVFSLEDGLKLIATRGKLIQNLPQNGAMVALLASEYQALKAIAPYQQDVTIAAINAPQSVVISGDKKAIQAICDELDYQGIKNKRLNVSHGFHSPLMQPVLAEFREVVREVKLSPPQIKFISNLTGKLVTIELTEPDYWVNHIIQPVRFAAGINSLNAENIDILLEMGAKPILLAMGRQCIPETNKLWLPSLRPEQDDWQQLLSSIKELYLHGVDIDWSGFDRDYQRDRQHLPTYPFQRQRYWLEEKKSPQKHLESETLKKQDLADWFYLPSWKRSITPTEQVNKNSVKSCILLFIDDCDLGKSIRQQLEVEGNDAIGVYVNSQFTKISNREYTINPTQADDYHTLLKELKKLKQKPTKIIHLWNVTTNLSRESFEELQNLGFYSLIFLVQALVKYNFTQPIQLTVISNNLQEVNGEEKILPAKATLLAACKVIGQEYPQIEPCSIDIALPQSAKQRQTILLQLLGEIKVPSSAMAIAYRGNHRWVQTFEPIRLEKLVAEKLRLRQQGVYLITGGLGAIGLIIAEYLAKTFQAKLILTGRSSFPARQHWDRWLANHEPQDKISDQIKKLRLLENIGSEVLVLRADVADKQQMRSAIAEAENHFGQINGVIHSVMTTKEKSWCLIDKLNKAKCQEHFQGKVQGTLVLAEILQSKNLDFCLLMSSISSVLGGLELAAYSAANLFMDTFVHYHNRISSVPWISINWEMWQLGNHESTNHHKGTSLTSLAITPAEGMQALELILASRGLQQIILSTGDLETRIQQWVKRKLTDESNPDSPPSSYSQTILRQQLETASTQERKLILTTYIRSQIGRVLGVDAPEKINLQHKLIDLGFDSLMAIELNSNLQSSLGSSLPATLLFEYPTLEVLIDYLLDTLKEDFSDSHQETNYSTLIPIQTEGSRPPFFCVSGIIGNGFDIYHLSRFLGSQQPFYGLRSLGLDEDVEPLTNMADIAAYHIQAIQKIQPTGPYFLGGHSFGGKVAFAIANQLHQQGQEVSLLAIMDIQVPVVEQEKDAINWDDSKYTKGLVSMFERSLGKTLAMPSNFNSLNWDEQIKLMLLALSKVGQVYEETELKRLFRVYKANMQAMTQYVPQEVYPHQITLLRANEVHPEDDFLPDETMSQQDPTWGWSQLSGQPLDWQIVPGNHFTMMMEPNVQILAQKLSMSLNLKHL